LSQQRPLEIIYDKNDIGFPVLKCIRSPSIGAQLTSYSGQAESFNVLRGVSLARKYFKDTEWPSALVEMRARQWQNNLTWTAFAIMVHNLEKNMLAI